MNNQMSDFEKLVIAKKYIKKILFEKGELISERDELLHVIADHMKMSKKELADKKYNKAIHELTGQLQRKRSEFKKLKKENTELIRKLGLIKNKSPQKLV